MAVLGSPSLIIRTVSTDVQQHQKKMKCGNVCVTGCLEVRSCVKVEVTVLVSPSLIVLMVSVVEKLH